MNSKFRGIFPALVTPYTKTGDIHEQSLRNLVSLDLSKGVKGFYLCGSTAEAFLLSLEERKRIVDIVVDENNGRGTVVVHVGDVSTARSIDLAHHARQAGADAVSSVPPFYYPFSVDEIIGHYLAIVEAVGMPMILYNFPANSGFTMTPDLVAKLRKSDERIMGIKHTSMNLYDMEQILRVDEELVVLSGHDEVLLGALAMGAHGAIGSTYNFMPEFYVELMGAYARGEREKANSLQQRANRFIKLMKGSTGIPQVKAALELLGIECNGCRRPIRDLTQEQKKVIEQTLKEIGVLS